MMPNGNRYPQAFDEIALDRPLAERTAVMLITFKSHASGDVIMLENSGKVMLGLLGKDPRETKGIFTVDQLPSAIAALTKAVEVDKAAPAAPHAGETPTGLNSNDGDRLCQRAPPILELLERSLEERVPVTWGV